VDNVASCSGEGCAYKEIAAELQLLVGRFACTCTAFDVPDRAQAVIYASKRRWIEPA